MCRIQIDLKIKFQTNTCVLEVQLCRLISASLSLGACDLRQHQQHSTDYWILVDNRYRQPYSRDNGSTLHLKGSLWPSMNV